MVWALFCPNYVLTLLLHDLFFTSSVAFVFIIFVKINLYFYYLYIRANVNVLNKK